MRNPLQILQVLKEALAAHKTVVFLSEIQRARGVSPPVSFKTMTQVYLGDLGAKASIDLLADKVATRFYTTMNEEYTETSDGKTAKQIVDEWCAQVGFDQELQLSARYLIGWGNVFWWVGNPAAITAFKTIPPDAIADDGVKFAADGKLEKIVLDWSLGLKEISGDEVIHLAYNVITANPMGVGILQALCTPLDTGDGEREPFYQIKAKIHSGMAETIYTFGAPVELWSLSGVKDKTAKELHRELRTMPRRGRRIVVNPPAGSEAKVQPVVAERMRGMDYYVETLDDEYNLGLQTPLTRLIARRGYTEASSRTALEVAENRVFALQQFLKRAAERYIFNPLIAKAGLDPVKAQVRLNWGVPEALDYEKLTAILDKIAAILTVKPDIVTTQELRRILRDVAKLPLEKEQPQQGAVTEAKKVKSQWLLQRLE